jgi:hypothetical protein
VNARDAQVAFELALDVEMTIERGKGAQRSGNQGAVMQGEIVRAQ